MYNLEEKEAHTYLGEVLASRVEHLKMKESRTLKELRCKNVISNVSTAKLSSSGYNHKHCGMTRLYSVKRHTGVCNHGQEWPNIIG